MADRTPIIVAAITVLGTVTVALIANIDKVRSGLSGDAEASAARPAEPRPVAAEEPAAGLLTARPARTGPMSVNGLWKDTDGYLFRFEQDGATIRYTATKDGQDQGGGTGTIAGDKLDYAFTTPDDNAGTCTATLSPDRMTMSGTCTAGNASWPMTVTRTMLKPPTLHVAR